MSRAIISEDEFVLFESQIKAVLCDEDVQTYLKDTPIEIDGEATNGLFAYLIRYAQTIGVYPVYDKKLKGVGHASDLRTRIKPAPKPNILTDEFSEPTAIIKINQKFQIDMSDRDLYEATRGWWRVKENTVCQIKLALSVADGVVREAYRVSKWDYQDGMTSGRMAFTGVVDVEAHDKFVGRSIRNLFTKGAANPIRYFALTNECHV